MKHKYLLLVAPLFLCGCAGTPTESVPGTAEQPLITYESPITEDLSFSDTTEPDPSADELTPIDPLQSLDITPSDYFTPGVWTSLNTDDTGNFYIFDEDGIHGRMIPMADADGVDFLYSISGNEMTMYVGEELTPYSAELQRTSEGHIVINMTFLGTQDELTFLSGVSAGDFSFYPAARLAKMAEKYYTDQTGTKLAGVEYLISEDDMVVLNLWVKDENGWRSDVESYTVSMFTAFGWSSISFEEIDLSSISVTETFEALPEDDIPDVVEEYVQSMEM